MLTGEITKLETEIHPSGNWWGTLSVPDNKKGEQELCFLINVRPSKSVTVNKKSVTVNFFLVNFRPTQV
jgi:hypothetical protein